VRGRGGWRTGDKRLTSAGRAFAGGLGRGIRGGWVLGDGAFQGERGAALRRGPGLGGCGSMERGWEGFRGGRWGSVCGGRPVGDVYCRILCDVVLPRGQSGNDRGVRGLWSCVTSSCGDVSCGAGVTRCVDGRSLSSVLRGSIRTWSVGIPCSRWPCNEGGDERGVMVLSRCFRPCAVWFQWVQPFEVGGSQSAAWRAGPHVGGFSPSPPAPSFPLRSCPRPLRPPWEPPSWAEPRPP